MKILEAGMKWSASSVIFGVMLLLIGCETTGDVVVRVDPNELSEMTTPTSLAEVSVKDSRTLDTGASKREAAFGVPMGNISFAPDEVELVQRTLENELTNLLNAKGYEKTQFFSSDLIEFRVYTDTTPLYWDVVGRVVLRLKLRDRTLPLFGTHTVRTYAWPSEEIIQTVVQESLAQVTTELRSTLQGLPSQQLAGLSVPLRIDVPATATETKVSTPPGDFVSFYPLTTTVTTEPPALPRYEIECSVSVGTEDRESYFTLARKNNVEPPFFVLTGEKGPVKDLSKVVSFGESERSLSWGFVYDRNGDSWVDYVVFLDGAMPVKTDEIAHLIPEKPGAKHGDPIPNVPKEVELMFEHIELVFTHHADDNFDGKSDAVVAALRAPENPIWIYGNAVMRSRNFTQDVDEDWKFITDIGTRAGPAPRIEQRFDVSFFSGERPLESSSQLLAVINDGIRACREYKAVDWIELKHFSFARPDPKVWTTKILNESKTEFASERGNVLYQISLLETFPRFQSLTHLSAEATADDFRNHEHQTMVEKGVKTGLYELENLRRDEEVIGGKTFYTMKYSIKQNTAHHPQQLYQTAGLYLFFPNENLVNNFFVAHYNESAPRRELLTRSLEADFLSILETVSAHDQVVDIRPSNYEKRVRQLTWKKLTFEELDRQELTKEQADFFLAEQLVKCAEETRTSKSVSLKWFTKSKYLFLVDNKTKTVLTDETKKSEDCLINKYGWTREGMSPWWLKMPQD